MLKIGIPPQITYTLCVPHGCPTYATPILVHVHEMIERASLALQGLEACHYH